MDGPRLFIARSSEGESSKRRTDLEINLSHLVQTRICYPPFLLTLAYNLDKQIAANAWEVSFSKCLTTLKAFTVWDTML